LGLSLAAVFACLVPQHATLPLATDQDAPVTQVAENRDGVQSLPFLVSIKEIQMKYPLRQRKTEVALAESLLRQLNSYALAAGAAGVGLLALTPSADAKIVYTRSNIQIKIDGGLVGLDLNHDGINDFTFSNLFSVQRAAHAQSDAYSFSVLNVAPAQSANRVYEVQSNGRPCAAALKIGVTIGPKSPFEPTDSGLVMAFGSNGGGASCPWRPVMQAYLGLKFDIKGKSHFGWARIKRISTNGGGFPAVITGYAYETIPNKPIVSGRTKGVDDGAGEPDTLGDLALGKK
jgi:hypothetical protein